MAKFLTPFRAMRISLVRIAIFVWLFVTFLVSLRLFSSSSPPSEHPRGAPEDTGLRFHEGLRFGTPHQIQSSRAREASTTRRRNPISKLGRVTPANRHFKAQVHTSNRPGWEEYFRFKNTGSGRIWPESGRMEDRILNQIHLVHSDPIGQRLKKIVMYDGLDADMKPGQARFLDHKCPVNQCTLTDATDEASAADAILFKDFTMKPIVHRPPHQIWILFLLESAVSKPSLERLANKVNWTATYRTDSTIVTPYERFTFFANYTSLPARSPRDYAKGKTKKVAWFVSNCGAANGRQNYVAELQKYIDVDIYGACGSLTCFRGNADCDKKLRQYKFYLAFENSNCIDYITEKVYWNAYGRNLSDPNDVVPIVMGARPEDYARQLPPESYIHVDDFESPKALAEYLLKVDKDNNLYNSYFRWKGTGDYIDTKFWCRLCAMIHESRRTKHHQVYDKLHEWWRGDGVCVSPPSGDRWASWRGNTTTRRFNLNARYVRSWDERAQPATPLLRSHRRSNH